MSKFNSNDNDEAAEAADNDKPTNPAAGARTLGEWHGEGRFIAGPRDAGRAYDLLQATQDWGHRDPPPSREPSERALDLVALAGQGQYQLRAEPNEPGGYVLAVAHTERGYHLALIDSKGSVAPELLCNTDGKALTYESAEAAEADAGRLIELAAEREQERALEAEHELSR